MENETKSLEPVSAEGADEKEGNETVPVYDVELMDEAEVVKKNDPLPSRSFAEKIGRAAGVAMAILGFAADIRRAFRSNRVNGGRTPKCDGTGRGMGRGMGRKRKNRRRN